MSRRSKKRVIANIAFGMNLLLAGGAVGTSAYYLRRNNLKTVELYKDLEAADISGQGVYQALSELQLHVTSHMNANPPKLGDNASIQLKNTYDLALKAESDRASLAREALAREATAYCEASIRNVPLSERAACVSNYTSSRPITENKIVADLYKYDFVSPVWSADAAGWSVLAAVILILSLITQAITKIARVMIFRKI